MQWTQDIDDEFEELMQDFAALEPAIERACRFEDRLNRIERVLDLQDEGETNA